jgi:chromosome segregation ATPase
MVSQEITIGGNVVGAALGALGLIGAAYLAYLGTRRQAAGAKEASSESSAQRSQDRALKAWEDLLAPHIDELKRLRARDVARDEHDRQVDVQLRGLRLRVVQLERENDTLLSMARVIARWAVRLRNQVEKLGGDPGDVPHELETLQAIEDATRSRRPAVASEDDPADGLPDIT